MHPDQPSGCFYFLIMITLQQAIQKKYPKYADKMAYYFQQATDCELTWDNITKPNLTDFSSYLQEELAKTTARTRCAMLKSVLGVYEEDVNLPRNWRDCLSVKKDTSQQVYLNEKELKVFSEYKPKDKYEKIVQYTFLLGCLTGARHSDFIKFTDSNVNDGFLTYVSIKTHTEATVPIAPMVKRLLDYIQSVGETTMADSTFNQILRRICMNSGINQSITLYRRGNFSTRGKYFFVSSHTARRTFATNLYLRGADLYAISKMMGHASIEMTAGYICCGLRHLSTKVTSYFSQFE